MVNPSVMLSFPHPGSVRTEFMMSVLAAMGGDSPVAPVMVHSGVRAGHVKTVPLGGQPWP